MDITINSTENLSDEIKSDKDQLEPTNKPSKINDQISFKLFGRM